MNKRQTLSQTNQQNHAYDDHCSMQCYVCASRWGGEGCCRRFLHSGWLYFKTVIITQWNISVSSTFCFSGNQMIYVQFCYLVPPAGKGSTAQTWCAASSHGIFPHIETCSYLLPPAYIYYIPQDSPNAHKLVITLDNIARIRPAVSRCTLNDTEQEVCRCSLQGQTIGFPWIFLDWMAKRIGFLRPT